MGGCASNDDQDPPPVKDKKRSKRASASTTTKGSPAPAESPQRETQTRTADVLLALTVSDFERWNENFNGSLPGGSSAHEWRNKYCDDHRTVVLHQDREVVNALYDVNLTTAASIAKHPEWQQFSEQCTAACPETNRRSYLMDPRQNSFLSFSHLRGRRTVDMFYTVQVDDHKAFLDHFEAAADSRALVCSSSVAGKFQAKDDTTWVGVLLLVVPVTTEALAILQEGWGEDSTERKETREICTLRELTPPANASASK